MYIHRYRRGALAAALCSVFATPGFATEFPFGVFVESGSVMALEHGDSISVSGVATARAITVESRGSFEATDARVDNRTSGNRAGYAYGLLAFGGSESAMYRSSVAMHGERSVGAQVQGDSRAVFQNVDFSTLGADSIGVTARAGALIGMNGVHMRVDGANSTGFLSQGKEAVMVARADIDHRGGVSAPGRAQAVAVRDGGHISLSDSSIVARQAGVGAVTLSGEASHFSASRSRIFAEGEHAWALTGAGGDVIFNDSEVRGTGGAITTRLAGPGSLQVELVEHSRMSGDVETGDASLVLRAEDSDLQGDMHRSGKGALDASLVRSRWAGRADAVSALRLDAGEWSLTGDSYVGRLSLAGGARIGFDSGIAAFGNLRVGQLDGGAGDAVVHLRTRLDAGGDLSRQGTDRLLVDGDVIGTTWLEVVMAGGAGAATAPGSGGGISLAQVGGAAGASSFRLAGDYVVVGPWRYGLKAYAPDQSDSSQRLVSAAAGGFWDYRLQSTRVDAQGRRHDAFGRPLDGDTGRAPLRDALAPQVPAYLVLAGALFGYDRAAMESAVPHDLAADRDPALRVRTFGGHTSYRSTLGFTRFGIDSSRVDRGLQIAGDMLSFEGHASYMRTGLAVTVGGTRVSPRAVDGVSAASASARGVTLTHTLRRDDGWRLDAAYGITHHRVAVRTSARGERLARLRANGHDASLAASFLLAPSAHVVVNPGLSLLWQRQRLTSARDRDGIALHGAAPERITLRAGGRASMTFEPHAGALAAWSTYIDARYVAARDTGASLRLSGVRFATGRGGRHADIAAGASAELRAGVTLFADINHQARIGGAGDSGLGIRLGAAMPL